MMLPRPDSLPLPDSPAPLAGAEFAAFLRRFDMSASAPLAVAVSGGPDSTALAFCLHRWCRAQAPPPSLKAFIVDHGLRENSAAEAVRTKRVLDRIGVPAEILPWHHPPVVARLHETARSARYRLLAEACRRHGVRDLFLAHQREDQAETILMRLAKGSGIDGLAGMAQESRFEDLRLLRPLLHIEKARLVATCEAAGLSYVVDPGNASEKFARGRLRRVLPLLAEEGLTVERLLDLGRRAGDARAALDAATAMLLRVATHADEAGAIHIDLGHLRAAPRAIALRALARCLQALHRRDYMPEHDALLRLHDVLAAEGGAVFTLHGCVTGKSASEAVIMRELAAISGTPLLEPGATLAWDSRWTVSLAAGAGQSYAVRPLGNPPHDRLDRLAPGLRRRVPRGRVRAVLPALWLNGTLAIIPSYPWCPNQGVASAESMLAWPPPDGAWAA
ncbi:MAG: tRNA lysidine(34) synthetase TilS [Bdellovibrionales bacterium]